MMGLRHISHIKALPYPDWPIQRFSGSFPRINSPSLSTRWEEASRSGAGQHGSWQWPTNGQLWRASLMHCNLAHVINCIYLSLLQGREATRFRISKSFRAIILQSQLLKFFPPRCSPCVPVRIGLVLRTLLSVPNFVSRHPSCHNLSEVPAQRCDNPKRARQP